MANLLSFSALQWPVSPWTASPLSYWQTNFPKTTENFPAQSIGEKGFGYKASCFHRIVPGSLHWGGDIVTCRHSLGGRSFGGEKVDDENFIPKHTGPGILSMGDAGPTQMVPGCSSAKPEWLDGRCVVFGKVSEGRRTGSRNAALWVQEWQDQQEDHHC